MPKAGYVTGSRFKAMMTKGRKKNEEWGTTSEKLAIRIALERLGEIELELDTYTSDSMARGTAEEPNAIEAYERIHFVEIHGSQDFQQHPKHEYVGCTPDGLIGDEGIFETKNPDTENHVLHVLNGGQIDQYDWQVHGSLWVMPDREYVDFFSHDSRIKSDWLNSDTIRVHRDEEKIKQLEDRYVLFNEKVEEYMNKILKVKND